MLKFEHFLDVRYYETDQMGIVHHSNYIRYFECGRMSMLDQVGLPMHKIEEMGVMLPIVSVDCRYKVPAKLGDTLRVVTMMDESPRARLTVRTEIYNQHEQLVCNGSVTMGFINALTRRPIRCPEMLAAVFDKYINS